MVFGNPTQCKLLASETFAFEKLLGVTVTESLCYLRFIVNGILYHSSKHRGVKKRINSTKQLLYGRFCRILNMVVIKASHLLQHCGLIQELVNTGRYLCRNSRLNITSSFVSEVWELPNISAVSTELFYRKCVFIKSRDKNCHSTPK